MGICKPKFLAFLIFIFVAQISFAFSNNFNLLCEFVVLHKNIIENMNDSLIKNIYKKSVWYYNI